VTRKPGKHFKDFISETDDDWDADLEEETTDDILDGKFRPPKSIEYRPSPGKRIAGNGRSFSSPDTRGPSYPNPRRMNSQGLKPQFEGLVRGAWDPSGDSQFLILNAQAEV
jgi:hypothetical protein